MLGPHDPAQHCFPGAPGHAWDSFRAGLMWSGKGSPGCILGTGGSSLSHLPIAWRAGPAAAALGPNLHYVGYRIPECSGQGAGELWLLPGPAGPHHLLCSRLGGHPARLGRGGGSRSLAISGADMASGP